MKFVTQVQMQLYYYLIKYLAFHNEQKYIIIFVNIIDPPQVNLKSILIFFTGADTIPPQGYPSANLYFSHSNIFPTASTCAITLTLPTKHIKYEHFKSHMNIAFSMHGGFGLM